MFSKLFSERAGRPSALNGRLISRLLGREMGQAQQVDDMPQNKIAPQVYQAPQTYGSFSQSFQPQQRPPVTDIYQRGAMPNDLLARYNSMAQMLQQQQAAMVPRTNANTTRPPPDKWMGANNPYTNFAQLFGGRNG